MKAKKSEVDYSPGHANSHCGPYRERDKGSCKHFEAPASCTQVEGKIDRAMWCKLFKRTVK